MAEQQDTGNTSAHPQQAQTGLASLLEALRRAGAAQADPAGLRYVESLAGRAAACKGLAAQALLAKAASAAAVVQQRVDRAREDAASALAAATLDHPQAAPELQRLFEQGHYRQLHARHRALSASARLAPLRALVRDLAQPDSAASAPAMPTAVPANAQPAPELKTLRNARKVWSQLSVDKKVSSALKQAPKNAGPINSHMLLLRSLAMMRSISPDYLNRFISYADTLLALDEREPEKQEKPAKARAAGKAAAPARVRKGKTAG